MSQPDNLGSFFAENKNLLKEYLETRMEIYRLQSLRLFARSAGYFAWILLSLFLAFLFLLFGGMMTAFWFSELFHSYFKGFGLVTLLILVVFLLLAIFRKALFVNPVIHSVIQKSKEEDEDHAQA
ncbi:MAG TPA: hypothetical protein VNW04_12160 [Puia sp.]|jgi:hypothetical protein|nr:hypothetical protein [Puia sp.]